MSTIKDGGPAFPKLESSSIENYNSDWERRDRSVEHVSSEGMSLRDYFAAKVMQGMLAGRDVGSGAITYGWWAGHAYKMADAMLAAREAQP